MLFKVSLNGAVHAFVSLVSVCSRELVLNAILSQRLRELIAGELRAASLQVFGHFSLFCTICAQFVASLLLVKAFLPLPWPIILRVAMSIISSQTISRRPSGPFTSVKSIDQISLTLLHKYFWYTDFLLF